MSVLVWRLHRIPAAIAALLLAGFAAVLVVTVALAPGLLAITYFVVTRRDA